jgi:hypothetical protein
VRRLEEKTGILKSSAETATKLLKLRQYKATVVHGLQPRDAASSINFGKWLLSVSSWR